MCAEDQAHSLKTNYCSFFSFSLSYEGFNHYFKLKIIKNPNFKSLIYPLSHLPGYMTLLVIALDWSAEKQSYRWVPYLECRCSADGVSLSSENHEILECASVLRTEARARAEYLRRQGLFGWQLSPAPASELVSRDIRNVTARFKDTIKSQC